MEEGSGADGDEANALPQFALGHATELGIESPEKCFGGRGTPLVSLSDQPRNGGLRILVEQIGILSKGNRPIAWLTEKQTGGIRFGKVLLLSEKPGERPVCFPGFPFPRFPQVSTFYGAVSYIQLSEADNHEFLVWEDEASSFLLLCKSMHTDTAFLGTREQVLLAFCAKVKLF